MFENAVRDLANWWSSAFEIIPEGHLRNRTFLDVEKVLERYHLLSSNDDSVNGEMDVEVLQDVLDEDGEFIRSPKSLMKHALMAKGSRDTSAQLFTALCRALGIPARLVASLQSVPWQASVGKPKPKYERKTKGKGKGKGKTPTSESTSVASERGDSENEGDIKEVETSTPARDSKGKGMTTYFPGNGQQLDGGSTSAKAKGKEKAKPTIKLRKARPKGRTLGSPSPGSDASPCTCTQQ
jgi:xeroderma pigmentosum group C-complementing protein